MNGRRVKPLYSIGKRALDLAIAGSALALLWPLMLVIAVSVRLTLGSPVLFRQTRPGYRERPFVIYKFRTMIEAISPAGEALPDEERITRVGRWLRASSLDELPQLLNVIRGELSLVGPRPLLMEYLPLYTEEERRRHLVKPGITGWAQIAGRNDLSWPEKFRLDLEYVERRSFGLDILILVKTVLGVLTRRGIEGPGNIKFTRDPGTPRESGAGGERDRG